TWPGWRACSASPPRPHHWRVFEHSPSRPISIGMPRSSACSRAPASRTPRPVRPARRPSPNRSRTSTPSGACSAGERRRRPIPSRGPGRRPERPMMHWLAEIDGRRMTVEVPASSANLGAGYDCLAMALDIVNRVEVEVRGWSRGEVEISVDGEGAGELASDRSNRFVQGLEAALIAVRGEMPVGAAWRIEMRNKIPLARGLGSSAAATVGGLVAGSALLGEPLTNTDLLRLATEIEGHADNAAAALLGGFTVVGPGEGGLEALRFDAPRDLRAVLFIPDLRLETKAMRKVLPRTVPLADATANLGRVAIGVAGLAAQPRRAGSRPAVEAVHAEESGTRTALIASRRRAARSGCIREIDHDRFNPPSLRRAPRTRCPRRIRRRMFVGSRAGPSLQGRESGCPTGGKRWER